MSALSEYNEKISTRWRQEANTKQAELFFALGATDGGEVFLFWDNARGNEGILDYLKQVVAMLEKNKQKNFGTGAK